MCSATTFHVGTGYLICNLRGNSAVIIAPSEANLWLVLNFSRKLKLGRSRLFKWA